jgi:YVTN family beta-propeller protein
VAALAALHLWENHMNTGRISRLALAVVFSTAGVGTSLEAQGASTYKVAARHVLGGEGGWDYLAVDTVGHRLFVTRTNRVTAVDLTTGAVLGEMPGLNRGHGVAFDYAHRRGYATSGADSTVVMFDLGTLKELGRATAAIDADAILYDAGTHHVLTFNGDAGSASVIDATSLKRVATIPLGGKPEFAVSDDRGRIFVNIADKSEVAELDPKALKVVRRWSIKPCDDPSGLAIDRVHGRLFSVCGNKLMAVSDIAHHRLLTTLPIGAGVDAAAFDPSTGNAFASNGEGTLTIVHEDSPTRFHVAQTLETMAGARTMTIDPTTHRLYTLGAQYGPAPTAATTANPRRRPPIVPGSATVLVIDR